MATPCDRIDGVQDWCSLNIVPEPERLGRRYVNEDRLQPRKNRERIREQMGDYVMLMLGAPVVKVELDRQQLSLAVDEALRVFEEHAPASYYQYFYFMTTAGQARYKLPPDIGLIRQVFWRSGYTHCDNLSTALDGAIALPHMNDGLTDYYGYFMGYTTAAPMYGRSGEWVLMQQYNEMYKRLSSANGGWEWGPENEILLYPNPLGNEWVCVHYLQRMKEWPEVVTWMQQYALAEAKEMLGRIRSKYATVPGPNGGLTLDGPQLISEAREDKPLLLQQLLDKWAADHMYIVIG